MPGVRAWTVPERPSHRPDCLRLCNKSKLTLWIWIRKIFVKFFSDPSIEGAPLQGSRTALQNMLTLPDSRFHFLMGRQNMLRDLDANILNSYGIMLLIGKSSVRARAFHRICDPGTNRKEGEEGGLTPSVYFSDLKFNRLKLLKRFKLMFSVPINTRQMHFRRMILFSNLCTIRTLQRINRLKSACGRVFPYQGCSQIPAARSWNCKDIRR